MIREWHVFRNGSRDPQPYAVSEVKALPEYPHLQVWREGLAEWVSPLSQSAFAEGRTAVTRASSPIAVGRTADAPDARPALRRWLTGCGGALLLALVILFLAFDYVRRHYVITDPAEVSRLAREVVGFRMPEGEGERGIFYLDILGMANTALIADTRTPPRLMLSIASCDTALRNTLHASGSFEEKWRRDKSAQLRNERRLLCRLAGETVAVKAYEVVTEGDTGPRLLQCYKLQADRPARSYLLQIIVEGVEADTEALATLATLRFAGDMAPRR